MFVVRRRRAFDARTRWPFGLGKCSTPSTRRCATTSCDRGPAPPTKRIAIVGAGFAGLATAYNLLAQAKREPKGSTVCHIYDAGPGASSVASGLLHPLNTRGKLAWMGLEAMEETLALMNAATRQCGSTLDASTILKRTGVLKVAKDAKDFERFKRLSEDASLGTLDIKLVTRDGCARGTDEISNPPGYMHTPHGYVVNSPEYLKVLKGACERLGEEISGPGGGEGLGEERTSFSFIPERIASVADLERRGYSEIILCAGAAVGTLDEARGIFPLRLSDTYAIDAVREPDQHREFLPGPLGSKPEPSLLGPTYVVKTGNVREEVTVGAIHTNLPVDPEDALGCRHHDPIRDKDRIPPDALALSAALLDKAKRIHPGQLEGYRVSSVHSGMRALAPKTPHGRMPAIMGVWDLGISARCWVFLGLGPRGLLYHALLGKRLARAVWTADEGALPTQVTRWKEYKYK